jgi:single-stranded DNA-binding protein
MKGVSSVTLSGNIGGPILEGRTTNEGDPCLGFRVAIEKPGCSQPVWAKVNVYGQQNVDLCQRRVKPGGYVIVAGELMNRITATGEQTMEIKGIVLIFPNTETKNGRTKEGG